MKSPSLAYLLGLPITIANARYTITSKLTSIENIPIPSDSTLGGETPDYLQTKNILTGKILTRGSKITFENKKQILDHNIDNPCYVYFSEDSNVNVEFAYFHDSYPLQVTPQHIFFWPGLGRNNFTTELDTNIELDKSNTAVYCGDLSDVLGEHTIEGERAQSIRLGSFPTSRNSLSHEGHFKLVAPVQPGCTVQLHFPPNHAPAKFRFSDGKGNPSQLNSLIKIERLHEKRSIIMSGFDQISKDLEKLNNREGQANQHQTTILDQNIYFQLDYSSVENITYSYNVIAEVMCHNEEGKEIDQSEMVFEDTSVKGDNLEKMLARLH